MALLEVSKFSYSGITIQALVSKQMESGLESETRDRTRVFVNNIPLTLTWQDLKDHFRVAGEVAYASVSQYPSGDSKGFGIVQFETADAAENAIRTMRNHPIQGQTLFVREDVQDRAKRADPSRGGNDRREMRAVDRRGGQKNSGTEATGQRAGNRATSTNGRWQRCDDDNFMLSAEASDLIQEYINEREKLK